jgi:hypothetical protein
MLLATEVSKPKIGLDYEDERAVVSYVSFSNDD